MSQLATKNHPHRARIVRVALLAVSSLALAQFIWPTGPGALREISVSGLSDEPLVTQFLTADGIPIWLVRQPDGNVGAFWARSPHRGCDVEYGTVTSGRLDGVVNSLLANSGQPGVFYDVCSGAAWLLDGTRIFGPGPRGLDQFEVELTGPSSATIDLRRTLVGACSSGVTFAAPPPHYCSTTEQPRYDSSPS